MTVYSTENCPQCQFLKQLLAFKNISFDICTDEKILASKNITNVPMLDTDGKLMSFPEAMQWLKER